MIHMDANYLAWAPNSTDDSMIPHPGEDEDHDDEHDDHDFEH